MEMLTIYHVDQGPVSMYLIDANHALANHPDEWSKKEWPGKKSDEKKAADKRRKLDPEKNGAVTTKTDDLGRTDGLKLSPGDDEDDHVEGTEKPLS